MPTKNIGLHFTFAVISLSLQFQGVKELEHLNETGELKILLQDFEVSCI